MGNGPVGHRGRVGADERNVGDCVAMLPDVASDRVLLRPTLPEDYPDTTIGQEDRLFIRLAFSGRAGELEAEHCGEKVLRRAEVGNP
ncbi:hypothetical protein GR925_12675 [Streptomyces sp. HUCO-GS316]|nr:hypothetical protein [Streptomyces sp. HUCO-GS316]MXM64277.1 hypothetical protein [Streptomyces sp. HUCO-GS316]